MMNLGAIKTVVGIVVAVGSNVIVKNVLKNVTPENVTGIKKYCVPVAQFAIAGMVAKRAADYTEDLIDEVHEGIVGARKTLGLMSEEARRINETK